MNDNMTPFQRCDAIDNLLDKLADAHGRAKCGYIYIIGELINQLREDINKIQNGIENREANEDGG